MQLGEAWPIPITTSPACSCGAVLWRHAGAFGATVIIKATLQLVPDREAQLIAPLPVLREDRMRAPGGSLEESAETAPFLTNAGVVLNGHACAPAGHPVTAAAVRLGLAGDGARIDKTLHVFGDRELSSPVVRPFEKMPLVYERAFGGVDVRENPVGVGAAPGSRQPNVVDPQAPRRPAGFGPIARDWPMRRNTVRAAEGDRATPASLAELPGDFDWRYFQAAPPDQQVRYLRGDEWLVLDGMHPELRRIQTRLPRITARAEWNLAGALGAGPARPVELHADTLVIDVDRMICSIVWRGRFVLHSPGLADSVRVSVALSVGVHASGATQQLPSVPDDLPSREDRSGDGDALDRTAEVNLGTLLSTVLPFSLEATPDLTVRKPPAQSRPEDDDGLSTTLEVNPAQLLAAAMPFAQPAADAPTRSGRQPEAIERDATPPMDSAQHDEKAERRAPVDTIERFAELSAALADPFASVDAVLGAAGLDGASWEAIQRTWTDRINSSPDPEGLWSTFGAVYAVHLRQRRDGPRATSQEAQPTIPGFLSSVAQPWRAEAAVVGRDAVGEPPPRRVLIEDESSGCAASSARPPECPFPCKR